MWAGIATLKGQSNKITTRFSFNRIHLGLVTMQLNVFSHTFLISPGYTYCTVILYPANLPPGESIFPEYNTTDSLPERLRGVSRDPVNGVNTQIVQHVLRLLKGTMSQKIMWILLQLSNAYICIFLKIKKNLGRKKRECSTLSNLYMICTTAISTV